MTESNEGRVVMMGATGAVGQQCAMALASDDRTVALTLLGRRHADVDGPHVAQHVVDAEDAKSYREHLAGHRAAICTVGVGEPSKVDKKTFVRIDKTLVLNFAQACRDAGVAHFSLLSSVGVSASSSTFYLRIKGELENGLRAMNFERLSLFHPSMILTPTNRYGVVQAVTLKVWPKLNTLLRGSATKYRGIRVEALGRAIAMNVFEASSGEEVLEWGDFHRLNTVTDG